MLNRRQFLQSSVDAAGLGLSVLFAPRLSYAQTAAEKKLVVVFQRGGNDGLNTLIPYTDSAYYDWRPDIAIAEPDVSNAQSALPLTGNSQFGLHPSMASLLPTWEQNNLAFFPTTHCGSNANRSHFFQWDYYDFGQHTSNLSQFNDGKGWIGRYLDAKFSNSLGIEAYDYDAGRYRTVNGSHPVLALSAPDDTYLGATPAVTDAIVERLLAKNALTGMTGNELKALYMSEQALLFDKLSLLKAIPFDELAPQNGAVYSNSQFGKQFKNIAKMIKSRPELEVVSLSRGGWDFHSNQLTRQNSLLGDTSNNLSAFMTDMGEAMDDILIIVMTEFGRTTKQNGSEGTDHGNASCWMAMGGEVNGGVYGDWPGLAVEDLRQGRYLQQTLDYRDILSEALAYIGASDPAAAFPEYQYSPLNYTAAV